MNRLLKAIQILSIIFISVALVYYLSSDSDLNSEHVQAPHSSTKKHKLQFSFKSGFYTEPIRLEISNPKDSSCTIFYSLDCSIPDNNSLKYNGPILLDFSSNASGNIKDESHQASVLRCIAYRNNNPISDVRTGVFFIDSMIFFKYPYPILSLVVEPGLTPAKSTDELKTHITLVNNNGFVGISQDAGLRVHINPLTQSRLGLLELISRKKYGTRYFDYAIFKQNNKPKYQNFELKKLEDNTFIFKNKNMGDLDVDTAKYSSYIVYINERLEGIYISGEFTVGNTNDPN